MYENNVSDHNGWSLGKLNNVREVFGKCVLHLSFYEVVPCKSNSVIINHPGPSMLLWLLPLQTCMGDGISFPTRLPLDCTTYHSIGMDF